MRYRFSAGWQSTLCKADTVDSAGTDKHGCLRISTEVGYRAYCAPCAIKIQKHIAHTQPSVHSSLCPYSQSSVCSNAVPIQRTRECRTSRTRLTCRTATWLARNRRIVRASARQPSGQHPSQLRCAVASPRALRYFPPAAAHSCAVHLPHNKKNASQTRCVIF